MQRNASTDELYFVTLTVADWIDVFTRRYYSDFIIENLVPTCVARGDQQNANVNIYAYVIMTNHIHMVANVTDGSLGDVLGRFKSFTSKELYKIIASNIQESRGEWMLKAFDRAGKHNPIKRKASASWRTERKLPGCSFYTFGYRTKNRLHARKIRQLADRVRGVGA